MNKLLLLFLLLPTFALSETWVCIDDETKSKMEFYRNKDNLEWDGVMKFKIVKEDQLNICYENKEFGDYSYNITTICLEKNYKPKFTYSSHFTHSIPNVAYGYCDIFQGKKMNE